MFSPRRRPWFGVFIVLLVAAVGFVLGERPVEQHLRIDLGERRDLLRRVSLVCQGPEGETASIVWREESFGRFVDHRWLSTHGAAECTLAVASLTARVSFDRDLTLNGASIVIHAGGEVSRLGSAASE